MGFVFAGGTSRPCAFSFKVSFDVYKISGKLLN